MSAIAGVFGRSQAGGDAAVRALLEPMSRRGHDEAGTWHGAGAALGVSRFGFELGPGFSGPFTVVEDGDLVVAADASLYYRRELQRELEAAGYRTRDTPGHLIMSVYRAWGEAGVARLEGDFAFVLYDRRQDAVVCGRDIIGRRPLHYAHEAGVLVVASTIGGVRAHPAVPAELNMAAIAETAGAIFDASHETVFAAVRSLPAGCLLSYRDGRLVTAPYWRPPAIDASGASSFDKGAEELRELLVRAVAERLDEGAPSSVWLSGGWDSPAVFAAGEAHYRRVGGGALRPVSISYPEGDPGREDELIESVLARWERTTHWINVDDVPFLQQPGEAAALREEPFAHAFEHWLRALARGSRARDARVALDGTGGDLLFSASLLYLADLLRHGRIPRLRSEWVGKGLTGGGLRKAYDLLVHPLLPAWMRSVGRTLRPGRSWAGAFEAHVPDWIDRGFARQHGLLERARRSAPPPEAATLADAELQYYLTHPTGARLVSAYTEIALTEGVEVRSPLYDRRLIEFAVRRPLEERTLGNETKRLLRRACADWLPAPFLAPRPYRTGGTGAYAHRSLRRAHADLIGDVFRSPVLAELGIVDAAALRWRWSEFLNGISRYELPLYLTFQTELWLRAHLGTDAAAGAADASAARVYA